MVRVEAAEAVFLIKKVKAKEVVTEFESLMMEGLVNQPNLIRKVEVVKDLA